MTKPRKSVRAAGAAGADSAADDAAPQPGPTPESAAPEWTAAAEPTAPDNERAAARSGRESGDLLVAMSPRQIIGGFAVLAGLIVMLRRRRRDKG